MPAGGGVPVKPIGQFLARLVRAGGGAAAGRAHRRGWWRRGRDRTGAGLGAPLPRAGADRAGVRHGGAAGEALHLMPDPSRAPRWWTPGVELGVRGSGRRVGGWQAGAVRRQLPGSGDRVCGRPAWSGRRCWPRRGWHATRSGCVRVNATLRSISHGFVFAAGDCATIEHGARPKAGVWAVRAGAPLAANLRRAARGQALRAVAASGGGTGHRWSRRWACSWRGGTAMAVSGRAVWRWKDWIDRRWMRMYQEPMAPMQGDDPMRCGGCGAKVGAEVLAGALAGLPRLPGADVLIGLDAPDDAAVMLPPPGMAVVQSVDHFRAFIDDPFVFGRSPRRMRCPTCMRWARGRGRRWRSRPCPIPRAARCGPSWPTCCRRDRGAGGGRLRAGGRPQRRGRRTGAGVCGHRAGRSGETAAQDRDCGRATHWC